MARLISTTSDYIAQGSAAVPTTGTASLWVYPTWAWNDGAEHNWLRVRNDSGGVKLLDLQKATDNNFYCGWYNAGTEKRVIAAASGLVQNAWNHLLLTWVDAGTTAFYLAGSSVGTTSATSTWGTSGTTRYLGIDAVSAGGSAASRLAEWSVWSAVLDAGERAALTAGVSPLLVRPQSLADYLPLIGRTSPEPNLRGGTAGTLTGTSQADHPRVYSPGKRARAVFVPAAGGGGSIVPLVQHLNRMRRAG